MLLSNFVLTLTVVIGLSVVCIQCFQTAPQQQTQAPTAAPAPVLNIAQKRPVIHHKRLPVNSGKKLTAGVFDDITNIGISKCAKECLLMRKCKLIGYDMVNHVCELGQNVTAIGTSSDVRAVVSLRLDWGDDEEELAGKCAKHTCAVGTKCIALTNQVAPVCIVSECVDPPYRGNIISPLLSSSKRVVGTTISYGNCAAGKTTHGQQTISCLASGQWSSTTYACCDCGDSYTVFGDCECLIRIKRDKDYDDAVDECDTYSVFQDQLAVINSTVQLQFLAGIISSDPKIVRIAGTRNNLNSKWVANGAVMDWIDDLPASLKDFPASSVNLAIEMLGNNVKLIGISANAREHFLCQIPRIV